MNNSDNTDKPQTINLDFSEPPVDAREAEGYSELVALLSRLNEALKSGRMPAPDFDEWDKTVKALLRPSEVARLEKPLRPHIPLDADTIQYARHFHLTKVLWARKGIEKLMKDTGF